MKKKSRIIAINGESWCRNVTGIERVAIETVKELDTMVESGKIELVVPRNAVNLPKLSNINIVTIKKNAVFFPKWTQIHFQKYVIKNRRISLDFSNTCPFFAPGIEYIHDIYAKLCPADYGSSFRDRLIQLYSNSMYRTIAKRAKKIITVSEFSKKTIADTYKINPDRIKVVYAGIASDYSAVSPDYSIFEQFPQLNEKPFFFSLGSLSTRKNIKWIVEHAALYPDEQFVISGKSLESIVPPELKKTTDLKNVTMTGYLTDGQVKALFEKCKAFIFPSYFEGFGIPPLEALSCSAKIIISNAASLPEIYGNCACYIQPEQPDVSLDSILQQKTERPEKLLETFTMRNSAARLYEILRDYL